MKININIYLVCYSSWCVHDNYWSWVVTCYTWKYQCCVILPIWYIGNIWHIWHIYIYTYIYTYMYTWYLSVLNMGTKISSPATPSSWSPLSSWQKNRLISLYHAKHDRGVDDENLSKHGLKMKMRPTNGESSSPMLFYFSLPHSKKTN